MRFNELPVITNIIYLHMKQNAVMRSKYQVAIKVVEAAYSKAATLLEIAKRVANKAYEKAIKLESNINKNGKNDWEKLVAKGSDIVGREVTDTAARHKRESWRKK